MVIEIVPDSPQDKAQQKKEQLARVKIALKSKLTDREISFVRLYTGIDQLSEVECQGNILQSMKASSMPCVGTPQNINQVGTRTLLKLGNTLEVALIAKGATDDRLAEVLIEGLEATKAHTFKGEVIDETPDHQERRKTVMDILKIQGKTGSKDKGSTAHPDVIAKSITLKKGKDGIFAQDD